MRGVPDEIRRRFEPDNLNLKYRLGFQREDEFDEDNSVVRIQNDILTITYRGEAELPIDGDLRLLPFSHFHMEFNFELSHFEMDVNGVHSHIRFNLHTNEAMNEMIAIRLEARETGDCKIDHSHFMVEFKKETK